jgi:hypothetical protein
MRTLSGDNTNPRSSPTNSKKAGNYEDAQARLVTFEPLWNGVSLAKFLPPELVLLSRSCSFRSKISTNMKAPTALNRDTRNMSFRAFNPVLDENK